MYLPISVIIWALLLAGFACAQDDISHSENNNFTAANNATFNAEPKNTGWSLYIDNDVFTLRPRDQDYTGGISFTLAGQRAASLFFSADPVLGAINNVFGMAPENHANGIHYIHSLQAGVAAFTPGDISVAEIIPGDRPYAGLVYIANSRLSINEKNPDMVEQTTLTIGMLGTSWLPWAQKTIHRETSDIEPEGWSHQISAGGEPTFRYSYAQQYLWLSDENEDSRYEIKPSMELAAGFITDANISLSARWGRISTPWWSFSPDRSEYFSQPSTGLAYASSASSKELYVWAGAKLKAHAYNVFLQGQFRDSDLRYSADEIRPLMLEAWLGVTGQVSRTYWLSWVIRYQTSELRVEPGDRPLVWGRIMVNKYF